MAPPVYHIVFHQEYWRIEYAGLYLGEFGTADAAADAALHVARSRIGANGVRIVTDPEGRLTVEEPE